ncbi:MAG: hypothetical protein II200_02700, partial [Bacteroidaceae bacterium]|nr:hypothetical protein [Bacteroidaceae bacterium]
MKNLILQLLLCFPLCLAAQEDTVLTQLFEQFRKASTFDHIYPREKVYLHLDNNAYLVGDSIWYKAYVVRASSLRPTELSRVLYVELLDDGGHVLERQQVRIDSCGGATGCLKLERPISNGFHEIRAFTREMLNWGEHACYSRVVPVFEEDKGQLDIVVPDKEWKLPSRAARPYDFGNKEERLLSLYPEGGHRIAGLSQRIAYQLTDGRGVACNDTLEVYDGEQLLALSAPLHEGRGTFELPANTKDAHVRIGKQRFELPEALAEGYTLYVAPDTNFVDIRIERTAGMASEAVGLAVFCREKPCYFDTLRVETAATFSLPIQVFHSGVNRIELFDRHGNSLASRMVFRQTPPKQLNIEVRQSKLQYEAHAPIALEVYLKDEAGNPMYANLSLAVREDAAELIASPHRTIDGEMLLSSEVRGYIHHPDYYFETTADSAEQRLRRRALDELLMVQGWSATDFSTMCDTSRFSMNYPIEDGLVLNGTMYKDKLKGLEPYPNMHLNLTLFSTTGDVMKAECITDSLGKFAFQATRDYEGEYAAHVFVKDEKGKSRWANVTFDRWFAPGLRKFNPAEFEYEQPQVLNLRPEVLTQPQEDIDLFEWKDTILDFRETFLNIAEVKGKRVYRPLQGNRYTWEGGEKKGRKHGEYFYNVKLELEKWRDKGLESHLNILDFLSLLLDSTYSSEPIDINSANQSINLENNSNETNKTNSNENSINIKKTTQLGGNVPYLLTELNGNRTAWLLNNDIKTNPSYANINLVEILVSEIKSASLVTEQNMVNRLLIGTTDNLPDQVIMLYERPNSYLYRSNKKVTKRTVWGYTTQKAFYSPNYYQMIMPKEPDNRRTLYWSPNLLIDDLGKASVVFFNNSHDGTQLRISIQGIT